MKTVAQMDTTVYKSLLRRTKKAYEKAANDANKQSAAFHAKKLKKNVPKSAHAPHLGDTIQTFAGNASKHEHGLSIGSTALPYAAALEFGHRLKGKWIEGVRYYIPLVVLMRKSHKSRVTRLVNKALKPLWGM